MNCIIIEDELPAQNIVKNYISKIPDIELINSFQTAISANNFLKDNVVDTIFLDINLPDISGLDFIKTIKKPPKIIITTAYPEYALESFEYEVIDYLIKPISFDRFLQAANKAYRLVNVTEKDNVFFVKSDKSLKKIEASEILFLEAMQNYVKIVTKDETIITHSTLKLLKSNL